MVDDVALDRELEQAADEALTRTDRDPEKAAQLLLNWINGQGVAAGIAERCLRDYITSLVAQRA